MQRDSILSKNLFLTFMQLRLHDFEQVLFNTIIVIKI